MSENFEYTTAARLSTLHHKPCDCATSHDPMYTHEVVSTFSAALEGGLTAPNDPDTVSVRLRLDDKSGLPVKHQEQHITLMSYNE